jgi:uncharacterized protein (DUF305 family)
LRQIAHPMATAAIVAVLGLPATVPSLSAPSAGALPAQPRGGSIIMTQQGTPQQGAGTPAGRPRPPTDATLAFRKQTLQLSPDMSIHYGNDPDKDFVTVLAAVRKGMVALARIELQYGKDPEMHRLAERIIAGEGQHGAGGGQTGEDGAPSDTTMAYRRTTGALQVDAQIRYSNNTDKDFAALLAAYHKCAVTLAGIALHDGKDPETRRVAEKIIADDQGDADGLKAWRAKHQ